MAGRVVRVVQVERWPFGPDAGLYGAAAMDLNLDGVSNNDRPLGVERNSSRLGRVVNLDLRYSRFIPLRDTFKGELFFEARNLFNTQNIAAVNRTIATDTAGNPTAGAIPSALPPTSGYDQRTMQLGLKFSF